ncbi:MAG: NAD-dependent epimerase/dehydratase family protein, partial [Pseudomonadota bacterium]
MTRRFLVTGATGFIGRNTLMPLLDKGFEVIAITSRPPETPMDGVRYVVCDLSDPAATRAAIDDIQATDLLHLAWQAVISGLWTAPENLAWIEISLKLAEAFIEAGGKRITVCGSSGDYDWTTGLCTEGVTPLMPSTFYGKAKVALYHALSGYCDIKNVSLAWGRVFFVYGPGEHPSRLTASVALSLLRGEEALCSHGMQLRDYCHVEDVGRGLAALAASQLTGDYNIASGEAVRVKDVILGIAAAAGRENLVRLGARQAPAYEPPLILANMAKTRA